MLYQPVLVKYPYVEPELTAEAHRHPKMAAAKTEDLERAFAVCCIATMSFGGYFLSLSLLSAFSAYLRTFFRFDLVWFRLSCDHGWIRSGSVNVR